MKLSIIIPVFNEKNTILELLRRVEEVKLKDIEKEIIIVDDGSNDGTREILKRIEGRYRTIYHKRNLGKGMAVRSGLKWANGDYIIVQDADLEYNPQDIKLLLNQALKTRAKVVYGSRILGKDKNKTSNPLFYFGGRFLTFITNLLYGSKITDEPVGYKMFHREIFKKITLESRGFEFCPEITAKILKAGYKIEEVPVSYNPRSQKEGKKIKVFRDGLKAVWTLIRYKFKNIKWWMIILILFILVRILIFGSFWQASLARGGWENFYQQAQPAYSVLSVNFHDFCDWHPPLYYTFTSLILFFLRSQWFIYIIQIFLAFISLILTYKIARLFFSEKIAFISLALISIEPLWAWHNFLLVSENLFTPLILGGMYYLFKFLKFHNRRNIYWVAIILGLATLVRVNALFLIPLLSLLLILIFFFKKQLGIENVLNFNVKRFLMSLLILNAIFFAVLTPWIIRNKIVYGHFTLANILFTNMYFYNLPPLISLEKDISYQEAYDIVVKQADRDLGENVGDQGNCKLFDKNTFKKQLDYYKTKSQKYILSNFPTYLKIHLTKAVPFFFKSGYFGMWSAYSGEYSKPDITLLLLKGKMNQIIDFFSAINFKLIIYLLGIVFWGISSLAVVVSLIYSCFKDKTKFMFFVLSLGIIVGSALVVAPFVLARYRLPIYAFYLIPLIYMFTKLKLGLKLKKQ